jgi:hypothetical protein
MQDCHDAGVAAGAAAAGGAGALEGQGGWCCLPLVLLVAGRWVGV